MTGLINRIGNDVVYHFENATPTDFGALALGIVIVSWFLTRFYSE